MSSSEQIFDVNLWGDTQAGKTTALTAYLCHHPQRPEWLDRGAEESRKTLLSLSNTYWSRLRQNQLPLGTQRPDFLPVRHCDGRLVRFRDMQGSDSIQLPPEEEKALNEAAATLIFFEWPGQRIATNYLSYETARRFAKGPYALVITKVECHLTPEQADYFAQDPLDMARRLNLPESFMQMLEQTPLGQVFPISVYGYSTDGSPAHYQDEFGRLLPRNIKPYCVTAPFDYVLKQVF